VKKCAVFGKMYRKIPKTAALFIGFLTITTVGLWLTHNGGIGKIAALPSFEKVCYFCRQLLVGKYVGSRNLANTQIVKCNGGQNPYKIKTFR